MFVRCGAIERLLLAAFMVAELFGQTGQFTGLVTDPTGAVVSGAKVDVTKTSTAITRTTNTNSEGYFTFPLLDPGEYRVSISMAGFRPVTRSGIQLDVAQVARLDFKLEIGQVQEEVQIDARAPLLQSESASLGQVIAEREVLNLPLNGRNFTQLATLTPGAVTTPAATSIGGPNIIINGMRKSKTVYTIDGVNVSDQHYSGAALLPPPDAIQEFKVQTNDLPAEYGMGGGSIDVQLKSGTNRFHGGLYEFLRNDSFDARNFFALSKAPLKQNQLGGLLGGPIQRNKLFFFMDYQGTRVRKGTTFNAIVPTAAQRMGDFSGSKSIVDPLSGIPFANNQIPQARFSPQTTFFDQYIPLSNNPSGTYTRNASNPTSGDQFDIRVDETFRSADTLKYSYSYQQNASTIPGAFPSVGAETDATVDQRAGFGETHVFRPNLLNEFRISWVRDGGSKLQQGAGTNYTAQSGIGGFELTSAENPGFPQLLVSGYTGPIADLTFQPLVRRQNSYGATDSITWSKGAHTIKAGAEARAAGDVVANGATSRGSFTFNGTFSGNAFADFLLGYPFQGQRTFPRNEYGEFFGYQHFFVQDSWKATARLTINVGLRYELNHPPTILHDTYASVDPVARKIIVASDSKGNTATTAQQVTSLVLPLFASYIVPSSQARVPPTLRNINLHDFGPRVGIAWRAFSELVLRAGYGIAYGPEEGNQVISTGFVNPPFIVDELTTFNTTPAPTKTLATFYPPITSQGYGLGPVAFFQMDPNRPTPQFQQWNLTVQKMFKKILVVEAAYVGNKGTHVEFSAPLNVPAPGPGAIQSRRDWNLFGSGSYISNTENLNYHGLQTKAEIRAWRDFTMLAAYTFAKSIDAASSEYQGSPVQDPNNIKAERGLSNYDVPQRFTATALYAVPAIAKAPLAVKEVLGHWQFSSIVTLQSGLPYSPGISTDPANTGRSMRPDRIASGMLANPTLNEWFDVSAFRVPGLYIYGNAGRNILFGPRTSNWDFSVFREIPLRLREGTRFEFRAEFFNFTNTPAFGTPTTNIQSPAAGKILSAGSPRIMQFALKFFF